MIKNISRRCLGVWLGAILAGWGHFTALAQQRTNDLSNSIKAEATGTVFTVKQQPAFTCTGKAAATADYEVKNHQDKVTAKGKWNLQEKLVLKTLPRGYYRLTITAESGKTAGSRTFAVVADPATRKSSPEMTYAVDSAQSWLCRPDPKNPMYSGDGNAITAELIYLAGINYTRERLSWNQTEPGKGTLKWGNYLRNAEMLEKYGIRVSGMFHDSPGWTRTNSGKLPDDLKATYDYTRTLTGIFKGKMADWEFWNEQDGGFSFDGAWDYAACMKAAYLGFKAGNPNLPVLPGAFCNYPFQPYIKVAFDNDLADYFDIFNFHTYSDIAEYPRIIAELRALLKPYHADEKPLWITECGILSEGMGKLKSGVPGVMAHSPEQEIAVAEFLPKSQITMQTLGVAKSFFFVLPPYNEQNGNKDWGLLRRDYTVKAGYVAFATLTEQLGAAKYAGQLDWGKGTKAYLFQQPDGSQSAAFWTDAKPEAVTLTVPAGAYPLTDFLGAASTVKTGNDGKLKLTATRYPAYISGLSGLTPSVPPVTLNTANQATATAKDLTVIVRAHFSADFAMNAGRDRVDIKGSKGKLKMTVWNLSDQEKSGTLTVRGGTVTGLPEQIKIGAWNKNEFTIEYTPEFAAKASATRLEVSGRFGGKEISRLAVPVMQLDRARKACTAQPLPWTADPGSWQAGSSGKMTISAVPNEKAVKFDVKFTTKVDKWVYPIYVLQLPQESLRNAFGIAFEIKTDGSAPRKNVMMLEGEKADGRKCAHWLEYAPPTAEWSERLVVISDFNDLADIKQIKIGMNPNEEQKTFYLRNIRILFLK